MVDCRKCGQRFRADHLGELACPEKPSKHPGEGPNCDLTEARDFNLMFETTMGPVKDSGATVYLRPETAQGIFVNFKNVLQFSRKKPPFGIAQVGKSFRNEITPGNFIFRTREFEQMEMEFFVPPDEAAQWYDYWKQLRFDWYVELGIRADHLQLREHDPDELSALLVRHRRRRVPLPDRLVGARGHRQPRRLRPHAAREVLRREARVLRPADQGALRPARHRAGRRRRPRDARVPRRRLRRGGGRRASSARCSSSTRAWRR